MKSGHNPFDDTCSLHTLALLTLALPVAALGLATNLGCMDAALEGYDDDSADSGAYDDDAGDDDDDDMGDDDAADDDTGDDDIGDDDTDAPPCGDGTWGEIPDDAVQYFFVSAENGDPGNTGGQYDPLDTVEAALAAARAMGDPAVVAIIDGEFAVNLELGVDPKYTDDDLTIAGCSAADVTLVALDPELPTVTVLGADGLVLRGLTVRSGTPGVAVAGGAGDGAPVEITRVVVDQANGVGVVIDDVSGSGDTHAVLDEVSVNQPKTVDDAYGWGIAVQRARATIQGATVEGATQVGVFVHLADVVIGSATAITGVAQDAQGELGRGIHLQLLSAGEIRDTTVFDCADAGIAVNAGMDVLLDGNTVTGTVPSALPGQAELSGDGILVTHGTSTFEPPFLRTVLQNNTASTNGRAGILIDGVSAAVVGNTAGPDNIFSPGGWDYTPSLVVQNGAQIDQGGDQWYDVDGDPGMAPLEHNRGELNWFDLGID